ncbi:MAG: SsrA-binding protein, partial [Candidatus Obscuribacterales bacterium]|nr:SsrA-binding protein [Candidatus Obscuribacterales bacterium]
MATKPTPTTNKAAGSGKPAEEQPVYKTISDNRKARHEYEIIDTVQCGITLTGTEVKALRAG